ncbi:Proteasome component ecm29 [Schizosaccharomyces pombe]|uniref:Proteasome component ecm29 n=1 Tax=Schizosaccharomyces pombe (strain 972 / ATCC 24843) TaxID=284812 RepID=ECM29_SCHPO|nr:proteasome component Ecm29 [Schizosaccharomyces pombe]Q9P7H8.1 RecName: Full=Proteasome component ecm29 [Schizosaccharomyces pombe 972h-]CAB66316.3 proteasome component Ecm29 [Schizosaccharomyces pombe]|eukprot:NP_001342940.1 proteasome component Ecm29 [Schizosaccharomyces pombe]
MAENELRLLNNAELKLALAESEDSFQSLVSVFLCPILLKLDSPHESVRNKTISIANHIMTRLNNNAQAILPLEALVSQYVEANQPLRKRFLLAFISIGEKRIPCSENLALLQICLNHVNEYPLVLLTLTIRLLRFSKPTSAITCSNDVILSLSSFYLIQKDQRIFSDLQFSQKTVDYRLSLLRWIHLSSWPSNWKWLAYFFASADSHSEVARLADEFTRDSGLPDLENLSHVNVLLDIALDKFRIEALHANFSVSISLRNKAIQHLLKSKIAANTDKAINCIEFILEAPPSMQPRLIQFTRWVVDKADPNFLKPKAAMILEKILSILSSNIIQSDLLRGFLYTTIGLLTKVDNHLITNSLLTNLLTSLQSELPDVRVSIDEALSIIIPYYSNFRFSNELLPVLEPFIFDSPESPAAYCALRFVLVAFPFDYLPARFICLKVQNPFVFHHSFIEEAKKGLNLSQWVQYNSVYSTNEAQEEDKVRAASYPSASEVISFILSDHDLKKFWESNAAEYCLAILEFIERCIYYSADRSLELYDNDKLSSIDALLIQDSKLREMVSEKCISLSNFNVFLEYVFYGTLLMHFEPTYALSRLVSFAPPEVTFSLPELDFLTSVFNFPLALRNTATRILGIILSTKDSTRISEVLSSCFTIISTSNNKNDNFFKAETALLIIGYTISYLAAQTNSAAVDSFILNSGSIKEFFSVLLEYLGSNVLHKKTTSLAIYKELFVYFTRDWITSYGVDFDEILNVLLRFLKEVEDTNVKVECLHVISRMSLSFSDDEMAEKILKAIYVTYHMDSPDILFASAEAMSILAGGHRNVFVKSTCPIFFQKQLDNYKADHYCFTLDFILTDCVNSPKPLLRRASSLWLFYIVRYCEPQTYTMTRLNDIYHSFLSFLVTQDDFVQDTASRGLKAMYDVLEGDERKSFTDNLISTIAADRVDEKTKAPLDADTALFTTNKGTVATYKDICSLASESGNPDLIYSFLSIAGNSSLWQARKGLASGISYLGIPEDQKRKTFSFDTSKSSSLLKKLYRFKHDPNPDVAKTMGEIWDTLVPSDLNLASHRKYLVEDCLEFMGSRSWRDRESSVNTLVSLLSNVPVTEYLNQLEDIWNMSFRTLDDIKESVREASFPLCKLLARSVIQSLEKTSHNTSPSGICKGKRIVSVALPFLLKHAYDQAKEVRSLTYSTITELVRTGNSTLTSFVPAIMQVMLEYLTEYESKAATFLDFHAKNYSIKQENIDNARTSAVQSSSMMDTLEKCIGLLDESSMQTLYPILNRMIAKPGGVPTKIGSAQVVMLLVIRRGPLVKQFASKLLQSLKSSCFDRNAAVSDAFASAIGYLLRVCPLEIASQTCQEIIDKFYDGNTNEQIISSKLTVYASRYAPDVFLNLGSLFFPFIFFGKHSSSISINGVLSKAWDELSSAGSSVNLYSEEIILLIQKNLIVTKWDVKRPAAAALLEFVNTSRLTYRQNDIYVLLNETMKDKSWPGKELLLEAYVKFLIKYPEFIKSQKMEEVHQVIVREFKRRNIVYKSHAMESVGELLSDENYRELDLYELSLNECGTFLQKEWFDKDDELNLEEKIALQRNSVYAMFNSSRPGNKNCNEMLLTYLSNALDENYLHWNVKLAILKNAPHLKKIMSNEEFLLYKDILYRCYEDNPSPKAKDYAEVIFGENYLSVLRN